MIEFANPKYLYWLFGLVPLIILSIGSYYWRMRSLRRFASSRSLRDVIMPERIGRKRLIKDALLLGTVVVLLIALARPQRPSNTSGQEHKGIEMMICIDVSNSMLATDIAPSRISFARRSISKLVDLHSADRIGIIIFAGNAYMQLPLTDDHSSVKEYLNSIHPSMLSAQGTNIASAVELAQHSFSSGDETSKAILIFTDGEDHQLGAVEATINASQNDCRVYIVGVGTEAGSGIPSAEGYLRDDAGEAVVSKLNVELGKQLANAGNGLFVSTQSEAELLQVLNTELNKLPKHTLGYVDRSGFTELYAPWIIVALLLLILEIFISQRKNRLWRTYNLFGNEE